MLLVLANAITAAGQRFNQQRTREDYSNGNYHLDGFYYAEVSPYFPPNISPKYFTLQDFAWFLDATHHVLGKSIRFEFFIFLSMLAPVLINISVFILILLRWWLIILDSWLYGPDQMFLLHLDKIDLLISIGNRLFKRSLKASESPSPIMENLVFSLPRSKQMLSAVESID